MISGKWEGSYRYLTPDNAPQGDRRFIMTLRQSLVGKLLGRFHGEVEDDNPNGMPGRGVIRGYVFFGRIRFTKHMPSLYVSENQKAMPIADYLKRFGYTLEKSLPHPKILYRGGFRREHASGRWEIPVSSIKLDSVTKLPIGRVTGEWQMSRKGGL